MKYLIQPTLKQGSIGTNCYGFKESCPYLCLSYCPTKAVNCPRPLGVGFSPTANDSGEENNVNK